MIDDHIPARFRAVCTYCHRGIDTRKQGAHQWTSGWVMVRGGGGGHGISCPVRENRWACSWCVSQEAKGHTNQREMW